MLWYIVNYAIFKRNNITLFQRERIRKVWDDKKDKWYFSVVEIVKVLTNQSDFQKARKYWNKLAERFKFEGSEVVTNCHRLKMIAEDGKMRLTDVADTETLF